jgi:hypothetical protein
MDRLSSHVRHGTSCPLNTDSLIELAQLSYSGIVEVLAKHVSLQIEAELSEMERTAMASKQHYSSRHGLSEAEVIRNAHQFIDRMDVEVVLLLLFSKYVLDIVVHSKHPEPERRQLLTVTCNTVDYLLLTPSARPLIQALFATGHVLI